MPTYDYRCRQCGNEFEIFQSMNDAKLTECAECGGALERLIGTGAGMIFKGSGFYITDYRSESYKKAQKKAESGDGKAPKKDSGKAAGGKNDSSGKKTSSSTTKPPSK